MDQVIIAGAGIAGLSLGLTLHQIGVPFTVCEAVRELKPLGVGINLQPNAVRELGDLGISAADLDSVGLPINEWALLGQNGHDIHSEARGIAAEYKWPQYAVHRGKFQLLLADILRQRAGADVIKTGARVTGYRYEEQNVFAQMTHADGSHSEQKATLLIGADGIHSALRAQMHPDQPEIHWGGALMWRGKTTACPLRTGASFVGLGGAKQRMVIYPISHPDPKTGLADINWIAEVHMDDPSARDASGWFRQAHVNDFEHYFSDWTYDWLNVPALLRGADAVFENPMIDRDPIPTWVDGPVALMGDAAHAMYPTGSNGASQAIVDARQIGAHILTHGVTPNALAAYNAALCGPISDLVLRNRGDGPFGLLNIVEDRCGGVFDNIEQVLPANERSDFLSGYKNAAGFAIQQLNSAPRIIPEGATIS